MSKTNDLFLAGDASEDIQNELSSSPILKSILSSTPMALNVWNSSMVNIMCNRHILNIFNIDDGEEYLENFYKFSPEFQPNGKSSSEMSAINFEKANREGKCVFSWMHQTLDGDLIPAEITLIKLEIPGVQNYLAGFIRDLRPDFYDLDNFKYDYYFNDKIPTKVLLNEMSLLSEEWFFSMDIRTGNFHYYGKMWTDNFDNASSLTTDKMFEEKFIHEDDIPSYMEMVDSFKKGSNATEDIRFISVDGLYRYYRIISKIIYDNEGSPIFAVGKGMDIHEQKVFEERSQKDLLTDCYNKISAENIISDKLASFRDGTHVYFIVDIDNFKSINDNLGHYFGDQVLREISAGLKAAFREIDVVARIGGDEFIVFVENMYDLEIVKQKAEKILEVYAKTYSGEYKNYSISGSIGIAVYPHDGITYDELYQNADKALNQAKMLGKNRYVIYSDDLDIGTTRSITKIENANRMASSFFDYDLISSAFNILYDDNGSNASINAVLKFLCQKYGADRSYIFETLDDGKSFSNTFEWCKEGISAEIDNLQELPAEMFEEFIGKAYNDIIYSNDLRETLQREDAFETMANQGILSFVHAQIKSDDKMTFFIGLDDCTKTRVWSEREINSLQYIGKMISIILQGTHLREEMKLLIEQNKSSAHILDNSDDLIYISDIENYELLYLNRTTIQALGNLPRESWFKKKCYEILQGKIEPCEFCTNSLLSVESNYEWSYYNPLLNKTFLLKDRLVPFNGKLARLEIATDITKLKELEDELNDRLTDEKFLLSCVEMLHTGQDPNIVIYRLLESVSNYYNAERSYIFEMSDCGQYISNTYEHCDEKTIPYKDKLQNLEKSELGVLLDKCEKDDVFSMAIDDPDISVDSLEYDLMKLQNLNNILVGSIMADKKKLTGFVGVDNPTTNINKLSIIRSVAKFIASFMDETELVAKLNNLSYYDTLTGIKNRHSYSNALDNINTNHIDSLGIAYVDILKLSAINYENGIAYGDNILICVANHLKDVFGDCVFRVGGDEFLVLSENSEETDFENNIQLLKQRLSEEEDFSVSIGYTWNRNLTNSNNKIGSSHVGGKYNRILSDNLDMEILNDKYIVYLQPQVDLSTGTVRSAEALVRRLGAKNVLQPPISFIPFYEKEGIISKIDIFVLEEVCKFLKACELSGNTQIKSVAVNCSRMTISKNGIVDKFKEVCDKYGVETSKIVIEITETISGFNENALPQVIESFSNAGFLVSLDDFGCGYSNLTSLVVSDYDELKIDMLLINDIIENQKSRSLTELAIAFCSKFDYIISVAEGVETKEQYELLKELGCNKVQGYYFDKPMPIKDFYAKYGSSSNL